MFKHEAGGSICQARAQAHLTVLWLECLAVARQTLMLVVTFGLCYNGMLSRYAVSIMSLPFLSQSPAKLLLIWNTVALCACFLQRVR